LIFLASLISVSLASTALYSQLFNDLLGDEDNSDNKYPEEYYCVRKYVNEAGLTDYHFKLNPKQIDPFSVNCDVQIRLAMGEAASKMASDKGLNKEQKKCVRKTFLDGRYFDAMAVVVAIGQLKELTMHQIDAERKKFITKMKEMEADCNKCFEVKKEDEKDEKTEEKKE
jgi:hypothetical protein